MTRRYANIERDKKSGKLNSMKNTNFNLTENAFHILKASYNTNRTDLAELVEDAEFSGIQGTETIHRAQQNLLSPLARLVEEISWLPQLSKSQISNTIFLISENNIASLTQLSEHLPELAKVNVLAHLIGTKSATLDTFHSLIDAWEEVDTLNVLEFLNNNRNKAGFPKIEMAQLENALQDLETLHSKNAANGIWSLDQPGQVMESIVENELVNHPSSSFLGHLVRSYDRLSEPDLVRINAEIDKCIERARKDDQNLKELVGEISERLVEWDEINQPVQVYEQHQGHEEARSKQIYEKLRALCFELVEDRGEFSEVRRLSEALLRTFPELESVAVILKKDVAQLAILDEQKKQQKIIEPLIAACENAKTQLPKLKKSLTKFGLSKNAQGPVSEILSTFEKALRTLTDKTAAFLIIRDLALYINNDRNDPETAFRLVDGLLLHNGAHPPQEVTAKLKEERRTLHQNWKMKELDKNSGNLAAMARTLDEMLSYAQGKERNELQKLKSSIERKLIFKRIKWGIYASIAILVGYFIINEEANKTSNRVSYQPSTQRTASSTPAVVQESIPPIGRGLSLNRSQVRYCVFQGERLESIRLLANTNYQIERFNQLIDDYNSRCSNYRYTEGVLGSIQREAASKTSEFQADAVRIFGSW